MEGQKRLVASEYADARYLYAAYKVFLRMNGHKGRWKLTKNGWRRYRQAVGLLNKAITDFEGTIPEADRRKLKRDLYSSEIYLHTCGPSHITVDDNDLIFITRNEMKDIISYAIEDCMLCDKSEKEVCRCKKRKAIDKAFTHEIPQIIDGECVWKSGAIRAVNERDLMYNMTWEDAERQNEIIREAEKE